MSFLSPGLLLTLGVAWCLVFWRFASAQRRAVGWIEAQVAPRFRPLLTAYRHSNLALHLSLVFVLGLLLVAAAAGPGKGGEGEATVAGGRLLLLLDASASMAADDAADDVAAEGGEGVRRFDAARSLALETAGRLEGHRFAVVTFSGEVSYQLPFTGDRELVTEALRVAELHTVYRNGGSSFAAALDAALHFVDGGPGEGAGSWGGASDLQVLLLSDGEQPFAESFESPLAALAERGVPVHAVAVGSEEGQSRLIWDFRDVVADVEPDQRRVLREYTTRRELRHLARIAQQTGGHFEIAGPTTTLHLEQAVRAAEGRRVRVVDPRAWRDLAVYPLALFVLLFLLETAYFDRPRRPPPVFDLDRLGPPQRRTKGGGATAAVAAAVLLAGGLLTLAGCGDSPLQRAHRENELGIAADAVGQHDEARRHYERSLGFGERPWIPLHNLARSRTLAGDPSEAHDLFQRALELKPHFPEALYNDGVALYRWGEAERDPRGCELERTRELWQVAAQRFAAVRGGSVESRGGDDEPWLARAARLDGEHAERAVAEVERLIADPPEACRQEGEGGEADDGGGGAGGGGGGAAGSGGGGGGGGGGSAGGGSAAGGTGGGGDDEAGGQAGDGQPPPAGGQGDDGGGDDGGGDDGSGDDGIGDGGGGDDGGGDDGSGDGGGGGGGDGDGDGGGQGGGQGGAGAPGGGNGAAEPLSADELEQVRQAYERMAEEIGEEGKYFRRGRSEQFPRDWWENPDEEIWW